MTITFQVSEKKSEKYVPPNAKYANKTYPSAVSSNLGDKFIRSTNGFVNTVVTAYNSHNDLVISPDDVWIAILNIFQIYVNENAEKLRSKLVSHEGKETITVYALGTLKTANYDSLCKLTTDELKKRIKDPSIVEWITPNFTTTKETDKTVCYAMLMSAMQKFYGYSWMLCCGLTSVTMLGEVSDWEKLLAKTKRIVEFDIDGKMKSWLDMLIPVLEQFITSASGKSDLDFWSKVCSHLTNGSGPAYSSGWITLFTIYNKYNKWMGDVKSCFAWGKTHISPWPVIDFSDMCSGYCVVPINLDDNGIAYKIKFHAGNLGLVYEDKAIKPKSGWEFYICNDEWLTEEEAEKKKNTNNY
jgi:hypothetical protein